MTEPTRQIEKSKLDHYPIIELTARAEAAEAQVAHHLATAVEESLACDAAEAQVAALEEGAGPAYKREKLLRIRADGEGAALRAALTTLVDKLDAVHADPRFADVWTSYYIHGGRYVAPTYTAELDAAKLALLADPAGCHLQGIPSMIAKKERADVISRR